MSLEAISEFLKRNLIAFVILGIGLALVIVGSWSWFSSSQSATPVSAIPLDAATSPIPTRVIAPTKTADITVDIEGAVKNPGVYSLPGGSRVEDAVTTAGGFTSTADKTKIAQAINLSAKLADSMKIYIPAIGDTVVLGASTDTGSNTTTGQININTANLSDLDNLPGVGPVTAQKIIDNRPYSSVEDLQTKKIVKANVYAEIKDKITVY